MICDNRRRKMMKRLRMKTREAKRETHEENETKRGII